MPDAKSFAVGEVLSAADVDEYLNGDYWKRIDRFIVPSGSPVTSVIFSSISSSFRLFRLTFSCQTSAHELELRLNNDSASNYNVQRHGLTGTVNDASSLSDTKVQLSWYASATTAAGQFLISKPNTANRGLVHGQSSQFVSPSTFTLYHAGANWNNTASLINRIDLLVPSGNFYGVVSLEGMRGV